MHALNVLTAKSYKGIGRAWIVKHLQGGETTSAIVSMLSKDSKEGVSVDDFEQRSEAFKADLDKLGGFADGAVALGDDGFPSCRGNVKPSEQPVFVLY